MLVFETVRFARLANSVIPAKAGIQPFVHANTWSGLVPGLRRDDALLEVANLLNTIYAPLGDIFLGENSIAELLPAISIPPFLNTFLRDNRGPLSKRHSQKT
jgi:hypothetical protein